MSESDGGVYYLLILFYFIIFFYYQPGDGLETRVKFKFSTESLWIASLLIRHLTVSMRNMVIEADIPYESS